MQAEKGTVYLSPCVIAAHSGIGKLPLKRQVIDIDVFLIKLSTQSFWRETNI